MSNVSEYPRTLTHPHYGEISVGDPKQEQNARKLGFATIGVESRAAARGYQEYPKYLRHRDDSSPTIVVASADEEEAAAGLGYVIEPGDPEGWERARATGARSGTAPDA